MDVLALSDAGIAAWLAVFARVAGWATLDPLLARLPLSLRLIIAAVLAAALLPSVMALSTVSPFSLAGLLALTLEWLLGATMALTVRILFAATEAMLAWVGQTATGGLLVMTEEQAQHSDPVLRQWAWWLAVLAFLSANGHLLIIHALMQGMVHLPVATLTSDINASQMIEGAAWIFAAGVQIALPLLVFVLLIQLSLAIVARTQPGVDMFSSGLAVGALGLLLALVWAVPLIAAGIQQGLVRMQTWLVSSGVQ